eukprot:3717013-Prymnesium_polylepis.1
MHGKSLPPRRVQRLSGRRCAHVEVARLSCLLPRRCVPPSPMLRPAPVAGPPLHAAVQPRAHPVA